MRQTKDDPTVKYQHEGSEPGDNQARDNQAAVQGTDQQPTDVFADLEATLDEVAQANPRIDTEQPDSSKTVSDLKALLEVSLATNSSLVLDDILQIVMHKAIELMQAERGLVMLLDDNGELLVRSVYNLHREETMEEEK